MELTEVRALRYDTQQDIAVHGPVLVLVEPRPTLDEGFMDEREDVRGCADDLIESVHGIGSEGDLSEYVPSGCMEKEAGRQCARKQRPTVVLKFIYDDI